MNDNKFIRWYRTQLSSTAFFKRMTTLSPKLRKLLHHVVIFGTRVGCYLASMGFGNTVWARRSPTQRNII